MIYLRVHKDIDLQKTYGTTYDQIDKCSTKKTRIYLILFQLDTGTLLKI